MPLRFAIKTPPHHGAWTDYLDIWRAADDMDVFESAWNYDHFYPLTEPTTGPCMEAWVTLAALAQVTSRIRIGCMVHGMHYRHPAVTANMAASLDIISGGRFNLGLGAGWHEAESGAYGIELGTVKERLDRFEEGIEVIVSLLGNETTTFSGEHYQLLDARCEPKSIQRPHPPIVIGGKGKRRTLRAVARWASMWDVNFIPPADLPEYLDVLAGHCAAVGRDVDDITIMAHVRWSSDLDSGGAAQQAAAYGDAGADVVVFSMVQPFAVARLEPLAESLRRLT
jgi:F420-dependent oxidoreductase-like protein